MAPSLETSTDLDFEIKQNLIKDLFNLICFKPSQNL